MWVQRTVDVGLACEDDVLRGVELLGDLVHEEAPEGGEPPASLVPLEQAVVANATDVPFGNLRVPVARAEELLALKILASRPNSDDMRDARALLAVTKQALDRARVRQYLEQFGPEHVARFDALLAERTGAHES